MEPVTSPLETVEPARTHRAALADALVTAAWADHHEELYAFLVRAVRDHEVAEDLLQETFLRLTREVRAGRAPDNTRAWLYRVAGNLVVSRGRRIGAAIRGLVRIATTARAPRTEEDPEIRYLHREGRAAIIGVLDGLAPDARAALLLSSEGFSGAEIAVAIGRSELATRALLCRTRLRVRSRLETAEASR